MSVELYSASEPGPAGINAALQSTSVGGNKPLHRFIKGQPKILGIVVLVLGTAFFLISIILRGDDLGLSMFHVVPSGFLQGALFIVCGILYILTEHNPTKKTVTASLALSIATILGSVWTFLTILPDLGHSHYYYYGHYESDNGTESNDAFSTSAYMAVEMTVMIIIVFYTFVGVIIFIVMSTLASAALRSTKSQAIVVMTAETATPAQ